MDIRALRLLRTQLRIALTLARLVGQSLVIMERLLALRERP